MESYQLTELEEVIILAHRVNETKNGCVFVNDYGHISLIEIEVRVSKDNYGDNYRLSNYRSGYDYEEDEEVIADLKKQLTDILESEV